MTQDSGALPLPQAQTIRTRRGIHHQPAAPSHGTPQARFGGPVPGAVGGDVAGAVRGGVR
ncbi:hypothetical protein OG923_15665 [Streptomyces halstedii]|uniref:hypothetical protein n=1 Tax=Streptomyces halstedii TaxID=1944 RepID=UPI003252FCA1